MKATPSLWTRKNLLAVLSFPVFLCALPAHAKTRQLEAPVPTAGDNPLLDVLLKNGVINEGQYKELRKKDISAAGNLALLDVLSLNGAITKDQANALKNSAGQPPVAAPAAPIPAPVLKNAPTPNPADGYARINEKGIEWGSNDGSFKAKIGGRVQVDSQINWNDPKTPNGADLANGVALRRARLFVEGLMYQDYEYRFEYDFARNNGGTQGITDAYVKWIHFAPFALTLGQTNEGKSMESTMSNNYLTFIERSLPNNAFIEAGPASKYQLGAIGEYFDKAFGMPYVLRGGITTESIGAPAPGSSSNNTEGQANAPGGTNSMGNNANRNQDSGNTSYQLVGRGVLLPYKDEDGNLVHTGVWGSYRSINNNYNTNGTVRSGGWQFVSQPDTNVDRTNWINTGNLTNVRCSNGAALPVTSTGTCALVNGQKGHVVTTHQVNDVNMFGAELLGAYGPFHWSSEYMMAKINGVGYDSDDLLQGFYLAGGWFLTGETRPYDEKKGTWNRVIPKANFLNGGGFGAWEVAARYDLMDMNTENIDGGALDIFTLGLNWYLTPRIRLMTDWVHVLATNTGQALAASGGKCSYPSQGGNAAIGCFNGLSPNIWESAVRFDF